MDPEASPKKSDQTSNTTSADDNSHTRLYISPLDPDLLNIVVPAAARSSARNISYHTIETFPEKRYGYVELPPMEAEKLRKKLNGATLKGAKMRIEKARPDERVESTGAVDVVEEKRSKKRKSADDAESSKKRKRDPNVVEGVVLQDRKVKRGWTESADTKRKNRKSKDKSSRQDKGKDKDKEKRKRVKSKYTEQDECLLKTKLPANAVGNLPPAEAYKKKKKKGNTREVTVHEFEKTTKFPSFLKNSAPDTNAKLATEFVQGKGWVDEDGNVVEAVKEKEQPVKPPKHKRTLQEKTPIAIAEDSGDDSTSSSGTSSEEEEDDDLDSDESAAASPTIGGGNKVSIKEAQAPPTPSPMTTNDNARPMSSSSTRSLTIKIPKTPAQVHPLEALYKRAKPDEATTTTQTPAQPFSFFGGDSQDAEEDEDVNAASNIPMTPFTPQDFKSRSVRSAAPTPDTAHPSRRKNFWDPDNNSGVGDFPVDDEEEEEEEEEEEGGEHEGEESQPAQEQAESSEFKTWFWQNRSDLNKAWMARKKVAGKEKRHKENKARASKAV